MFKQRLLSGIVLVLVLIAVIGFGGNVLLAFCLIISLIGMSELNGVVKTKFKLPGFISYLAAVVYFGLLFFKQQELILPLIIGALILLMAAYVFTFPEYNTEQIVTTFFGFIYVAVMLSYIYQARVLAGGSLGVAYVVLIFISSWGSDTCAYCVGMLIGKHKMSPKLSPKKSIEGGIGGVLGAALLGCIFALIMNQVTGSHHEAGLYAVVCGVGALISMVGDLAASAIKRNHEVKDYGHLIPGHGGILDRFDSVIFTAPIIYYMIRFM